MRPFCRVLSACATWGLLLAGLAEAQVTEDIRERAAQTLRGALRTETEWVRVHAAEALLHNGLPGGVEDAYLPEAETSPARHRIGVWRVLAQAQDDPEVRERYMQRIRSAFLDLDGPDRLHAAETLGKLGDAKRSTKLLEAAVQLDTPLAAYARLILANTGSVEDAEYLAALLGSYDDAVRRSAAYALRFAPNLDAATLARLRDTTKREPEASPARLHLLIAWLAHADMDEWPEIKRLLRPYAQSDVQAERYQYGEAMALRGGPAEVPALLRLLDDEDADVRVSAANALLALERRQR